MRGTRAGIRIVHRRPVPCGIEHKGVRVLRDLADKAHPVDGRGLIGWRSVCT